MGIHPTAMEAIRSVLGVFGGEMLSHDVTTTFDARFPSMHDAASFVAIMKESLKPKVTFIRYDQSYPFTGEVILSIPAAEDLFKP